MTKKHRLCGIECRFATDEDVWKVLTFQNLDLSERCFEVIESFAFLTGTGSGTKMLSLPRQLSPSFFEAEHEGIFIDSLVMHLYKQDALPQKIDTYTEYVESGAEMIILLYDGVSFEVYCKNRKWLETLWRNLCQMEGVKAYKKYEDTDTRTAMYV